MDTIYRLLRLNRILRSHRLKFAGILCADLLGLRHYFLRIDPVLACNLHCQMCHFSNPDQVVGRGRGFSKEELDRIASLFFNKTLQLVLGCGAEPTMYKHLLYILELGRKYRVPFIGMSTNGQLLTAEIIETLVTKPLDELTLSIHGVRAETYERLMPPARFQKLIEVLEMVETFRQKHQSLKPAVRINYTVNPDNLEELDGFFSVFGRFKIRTLQVRPIADLGNTEYRSKDLTPLLPVYDKVIARIGNECRKRNIIFLATKLDPTYRLRNVSSIALEYVKKTISPECVWRPDFKWRIESYRDYGKRIGWRRQLLRGIFTAPDHLPTRDRHLTYDVEI
jgi:molybdenum cofactor biosynthesis enzyme MoaA